MIFQIFQIKKIINNTRENPINFQKNHRSLMRILFFYFFSTLLFLILLFSLGFTSFLGGPYGFFKFLFFLSIFGFFILTYIFNKLYKLIKLSISLDYSKRRKETIIVESKIIK